MDARTHEEGVCDDCGSEYPTPWFAPNDLWNRVIPNRAGMLCPNCFLFRAQSAGINPTGWEIREEGTQWIKITDDPQTLPKPGGNSEFLNGRDSDQVLTTDGNSCEIARFIRWKKETIEGGFWTNSHIHPKYWREIGELPAPPPES